MKKALAFFLLAVSLSGCAGPSGQAPYNCGEGVCTTVKVVEPVRPNEPVTVIVTVTADRDIPDLEIWLSHDYGGEVEQPDPSEKAVVTFKDKNDMSWKAPVKANQPARSTRKVRLPPRDGLFGMVAHATIPGKGPVASDSVEIDLTRGGGTVYPANTSIPTPLTPIRAITMVATPVPRTPTASPSATPVRTTTRAPYP